MGSDFVSENKQIIAQEISRLPAVDGVSLSSSVPGDTSEWNNAFTPADKQGAQSISLGVVMADYDYLPVYQMPLLAGREFSRDRGEDIMAFEDGKPLSDFSMIINESA